MTIMPAPHIDRRSLSRLAWPIGIAAAAVLLWGGYRNHWSWTGFSDNDSLWAWLQLLVLPLSLAALPILLRSHRELSSSRRVVIGTVIVGSGLLITLGYALHLTWTGFSGNTLWDWLQLLVLPVSIATARFWTTERTIESKHRLGVAALTIGFAVFTACAYLLPIAWTGFVGNTLWDWTKLLIVPILMPLVLVPAASRWIARGIASIDDSPDDTAQQVSTYQVDVPDGPSLTVQVIWSPDEKSEPQLVVAERARPQSSVTVGG